MAVWCRREVFTAAGYYRTVSAPAAAKTALTPALTLLTASDERLECISPPDSVDITGFKTW